MSEKPITWDQIEDLVYQLKQVAESAKKAAATLTRHQIKPINRIKTLETQHHELNRATSKAIKSLLQYTSQLRVQHDQGTHPEDHPSALPTGASDKS